MQNRASRSGRGARLTEASFHYWRKRLMPAASTAPQLIVLPLAARHGGEPMLELETPHGYVIRLGTQGHVDWLGAVLAALR